MSNIPIADYALGTVLKVLEKRLEELEIGWWIETIQDLNSCRFVHFLRR